MNGIDLHQGFLYANLDSSLSPRGKSAFHSFHIATPYNTHQSFDPLTIYISNHSLTAFLSPGLSDPSTHSLLERPKFKFMGELKEGVGLVRSEDKRLLKEREGMRLALGKRVLETEDQRSQSVLEVGLMVMLGGVSWGLPQGIEGKRQGSSLGRLQSIHQLKCPIISSLRLWQHELLECLSHLHPLCPLSEFIHSHDTPDSLHTDSIIPYFDLPHLYSLSLCILLPPFHQHLQDLRLHVIHLTTLTFLFPNLKSLSNTFPHHYMFQAMLEICMSLDRCESISELAFLERLKFRGEGTCLVAPQSLIRTNCRHHVLIQIKFQFT
ncbi:hypothetical protein FGO68_gene6538 [Halteria grandinella]|uniref:Uncharacterized protein n=1 Tax=Halteria grandinella TaxID=5974 RepID=A0A8J8P126_HALGN|nr:hypothetical protein FGO68_gene6538 [Halteria grandinella]